MKYIIIITQFFIFSFSISAQIWEVIPENSIPKTIEKDFLVEKFIVAKINDSSIKETLWNAPHESINSSSKNTELEIMLPDGTIQKFEMVRYDMMEPSLATKYPNIRTFHGRSTTNHYNRIRADYTSEGFRAVISIGTDKIFIDPYEKGNKSLRIIYYKKDYSKQSEWSCDTESRINKGNGNRSINSGDCQFRSYKLVVATTGEYSNFHGANSSAESGLVMSAVTTVINRVNEVYEQDNTVRLILQSNTDDVFYYNANTDPYSNNNGGNMLSENQTTIDNIIGNSNYDIGHVFSTGGGGVAYLRSVCNNSIKAGGVTGQSNPIGDPFSIDYVSHEMGHQFGANHTQNNSCNRNNSTAMEPGSASSIMGYAGICSPNVQSNSDAYFHIVSIEEINDWITTGANSCAALITLNNNSPTLTPISDYTIPKSTPFVLTAEATDPDNDAMTYCWEQYDNEVGSMPPSSTNTVGPLFRTITPSTDAFRYFPSIDNIIDGTSDTWEVLPSVARMMEFKVTVRDYHNIAGCTSDDHMNITVDGTSGPFVINSQNSATNWQEGDIETITWAVANTDQSPINCNFVNIYFSNDGGLTYPTLLAANVPNDGSHNIFVPVGLTTQGRIMVKGHNNVFFDINNANITILSNSPTYSLFATPQYKDVCIPDTFFSTIDVISVNNYSTPVNLSLSNLAAGINYSFNTNPVTPGNSTLLKVYDISGSNGLMTFNLDANSSGMAKSSELYINLSSSQVPTLSTPSDNATEVELSPEFIWTVSANSTSYTIQVAFDSDFDYIVQESIVPSNSTILSMPFDGDYDYYWRVKSETVCGTTNWSSTFKFTTKLCLKYAAQDVPLAIPDNNPTGVTSTINIPVDGMITDLNILNLNGVHTYMDDLKFHISNPANAEQLAWNSQCGSVDDFNINLDDEASNQNWPCPPTDGLYYQPSTSFSSFDNQQSIGNWDLRVVDNANQDSGTLNNWELEVCFSNLCRLEVDKYAGYGMGSLAKAIECASDGDIITFHSDLNNQTIDIGTLGININKNISIVSSVANNITITSTKTPIVFNIPPNKTVIINGLSIESANSNNEAIFNQGILTLNNVQIKRQLGNTALHLLNNTGGTTIKNNCTIE